MQYRLGLSNGGISIVTCGFRHIPRIPGFDCPKAHKRDNYRQAFDGFDAEAVAVYDDVKVAESLANPGIVRNRLKINAAVRNAQ